MGGILSLDRQWTRYFARWVVLQFLLVICFVILCISIGVTIWQSENSPGDFKAILTSKHATSAISKLDWYNDFCLAPPYKFLSPFKFTYKFGCDPSCADDQIESAAFNKGPTFCPWPTGKTIFRCLLAVVQGFLHVVLLFPRFKEFSKLLGSPMLIVLSFMWYSILVLDSESLSSANAACSTSNLSKAFQDDLKKRGVELRDFSLTCDNISYSLTPFLDCLLFFLSFIMGRAWAQCRNKYGEPELLPPPDDTPPPNSPPSIPSASQKRATGTWWRASENARLSMIFPRNSTVVGGQERGRLPPTQAEMHARGVNISAEQYEKYSRIPGCLERILAYFGIAWGDNGDASTRPNSPLSRPHGSINQSFSNSTKGGNANRLNVNAVDISVNNNSLGLQNTTSSPISRPESRGFRKPIFVNTTPPPLKPPKPNHVLSGDTQAINSTRVDENERDMNLFMETGEGLDNSNLECGDRQQDEVNINMQSESSIHYSNGSFDESPSENVFEEKPPPPPLTQPPPLYSVVPPKPLKQPGNTASTPPSNPPSTPSE